MNENIALGHIKNQDCFKPYTIKSNLHMFTLRKHHNKKLFHNFDPQFFFLYEKDQSNLLVFPWQ